MIHMIPNENRSVVIYKGQQTQPDSGGGFGNPALVINGELVPYDELDAWYTERMLFDWRGQPFHLDRYRDGRVQGGYLGYDSYWAREQGLEGSGYEGRLCDVPESEIERPHRKDQPARAVALPQDLRGRTPKGPVRRRTASH